jgi:hypothetical protein
MSSNSLPSFLLTEEPDTVSPFTVGDDFEEPLHISLSLSAMTLRRLLSSLLAFSAVTVRRVASFSLSSSAMNVFP